MLEETKIPEQLIVGESYTVNVVKQYLQKHRASYVGDNIYNSNAFDEVKIVEAIRGNLHSYEDGFTHSSKNYSEVYQLVKL